MYSLIIDYRLCNVLINSNKYVEIEIMLRLVQSSIQSKVFNRFILLLMCHINSSIIFNQVVECFIQN